MNIFRKIWAIYGVFLFGLLLIISIPFYFIFFVFFPKRGVNIAVWYSAHVFARMFFILTFLRIKNHGLENIDLNRAYILLSNHSSSIDFMANAYAYPGVYRYLVKKELLKIPIMGFVLKRISVVVDRASKESKKKSLQALNQILEQGTSIFLYPEGTRNRTQEPLTQFKNGAFRLAIETGTPILTQTLVNARKISDPRIGIDYSPGTLHVVWNKPIETKDLDLNDLEELREKVYQQVLDNLETHARFVHAK